MGTFLLTIKCEIGLADKQGDSDDKLTPWELHTVCKTICVVGSPELEHLEEAVVHGICHCCTEKVYPTKKLFHCDDFAISASQVCYT